MLILVFGLPGTGKSYFSHKLKNFLSANYLNTDMIRQEIGKKGKYDEESRQRVYDVLYEKAKKILIQGEYLIVDGTFHKKSRRDRLKIIAQESGQKLHYILMKADENTVRQRVEKGRKYSEAGFEVYEKLREEFDEVCEDHLILWSDRDSTEVMLKKVKAFLYG